MAVEKFGYRRQKIDEYKLQGCQQILCSNSRVFQAIVSRVFFWIFQNLCHEYSRV